MYTQEMADEAQSFVKRARDMLVSRGWSAEREANTGNILYTHSHTRQVHSQIMEEFGISPQRANTAVGRAVREMRRKRNE